MPQAVLDAFINNQRVRGLSPLTVYRRTWSLRKWRQHLAPRLLADANALDVEAFLAQWPAAASRAAVRSDIDQLYKFMIRHGLAAANPAATVDRPRIPKRGATPIAPADVRRMIAGSDRETRLMVMLAAYAGLRVSEIGRLRRDDIDIDARRIAVRGGKGGVDAVVPLADELAAELAAWTEPGPLFGVHGAAVSGRIRRLLRRLGIQARPHDLRHSFATSVAECTSGNIWTTAALMRHKKLATTERYVRWHVTGSEVVSGLYGEQLTAVPA